VPADCEAKLGTKRPLALRREEAQSLDQVSLDARADVNSFHPDQHRSTLSGRKAGPGAGVRLRYLAPLTIARMWVSEARKVDTF
jgi:hypothetical protein